MPNLRLAKYQEQPPTQLAIEYPRRVRPSIPDSYDAALRQGRIEYKVPVTVDLVAAGRAVAPYVSKLATQVVSAPGKLLNQVKNQLPARKPVAPKRAFTIAVEPKFTAVNRNTGTSYPISKETYDLSTQHPTYLTNYQLFDSKEGPRIMSRIGKNALSNMRITNVSQPSAKSRRVKNTGRPMITAAANRGIRVRHSEYVSSIQTSATASAYTTQGFVLNPGKSGTFPWLSTIAVNFDKYRIVKCVFSLVTNQPTTKPGRVGLGIDYDSTDPLPADRSEFFSLTYHSECAVWDSLTFSPPFKSEEKFINSHTTTDSKLIDYGQLVLMTEGDTDTSTNIGDLLVDYVVELYEPQQATMLTQSVTFPANPVVSWDTYVMSGPIFANNILASGANGTNLSSLWSLPPGKYLVTLAASDAAAASPTLVVAGKSGFVTGRITGVGNTTVHNTIATLNVAVGPSGVDNVKVTLGGVTMATVDTIGITFSRISVVVFNALSLSLAAATGTY